MRPAIRKIILFFKIFYEPCDLPYFLYCCDFFLKKKKHSNKCQHSHDARQEIQTDIKRAGELNKTELSQISTSKKQQGRCVSNS